MSQPPRAASLRFLVLVVLSLQNSVFTLLRRYSQGILREQYSKYECLLVGELMKLCFSALMIRNERAALSRDDDTGRDVAARPHPLELLQSSGQMVGLALIYGAMSILSFISLRNIGAGLFTILAQLKILSTVTFSTLVLRRCYSWTKWRALTSLALGVVLFSHTVWDNNASFVSRDPGSLPLLGVAAVLLEVTLSGFATVYFEKILESDQMQVTLWERNFQLSSVSMPVYVLFIIADGGGTVGFFGGWSVIAMLVATLGAMGGLLVALSIKYGDSILKTLATTSAIVLSSVLDHIILDGPLTPIMGLAGAQVVIAICDYTFDESSVPLKPNETGKETSNLMQNVSEMAPLTKEETSEDP